MEQYPISCSRNNQHQYIWKQLKTVLFHKAYLNYAWLFCFITFYLVLLFSAGLFIQAFYLGVVLIYF